MVRRVLSVVCYVRCVVRWLRFDVGVFVGCCLVLVVCCLLVNDCGSLAVVFCVLCGCLLCGAYYLLFVV